MSPLKSPSMSEVNKSLVFTLGATTALPGGGRFWLEWRLALRACAIPEAFRAATTREVKKIGFRGKVDHQVWIRVNGPLEGQMRHNGRSFFCVNTLRNRGRSSSGTLAPKPSCFSKKVS